MNDVHERVQEIFRQVFDDPDLNLQEGLTADDVDGWDSLAHINLIIAVERALGIKFATAEIARLKMSDQNVGSLLQMIESKLGQGKSAS